MNKTQEILGFFGVKSIDEEDKWEIIKYEIISSMFYPLKEIQENIDKSLTKLGSDELGLSWVLDGPAIRSGKISLHIAINLNVYDDNTRDFTTTNKLLWCEVYYDKKGLYDGHCVVEEPVYATNS